jgi:indolepyruvate ferredoxin oxidoreductase beta subunit
MAFDDIVRVADLKSRASRMTRVHQEIKAEPDELVKVFDFFKPGVPEFAALLPSRLASMLMRWDNRRTQRGKSPLEFPIQVGTHSLFGMLMLRLLANLKWLRNRGSRYAHEQSAIEEWLSAIALATASHPSLGLAVARCGQLIKGYGSTNSRGHENWQYILRHLIHGSLVNESLQNPDARAMAVDQARAAALRDEGGLALDQMLHAFGAPKREVKVQPIRWMPRPRP